MVSVLATVFEKTHLTDELGTEEQKSFSILFISWYVLLKLLFSLLFSDRCHFSTLSEPW